MGKQNSKWFILLILALVWGSSFILMKKGLDGGMNAYQLGAYRIIFTSLFLLPILGKELFKIKKKKIKYIILAGLLGNFFPIFLFAVAQTEISSSISSTLNSFTPLNTLIIGSVFFGLTFSKKQIIGLLIGIVGCLTLVYAGASGNPTKNYWFALLVIIATWCYASNINLVKKHLHDVSPLAITVGNFAFLLLPALLILALNGFEFQIIQNSTESIGIFNSIHPLVYIAILGIIGTGLANIYFYRLIQMSSPIFASNVTYLIPVVATIWSVIFNENVTGLQVLGTAIILFGVYFTNRK
ncbi:DMT family transporter [Flavobacterium urocaniciphilum]|nr:DMT family transporter [Flavobacterium urocaniciphilum]